MMQQVNGCDLLSKCIFDVLKHIEKIPTHPRLCCIEYLEEKQDYRRYSFGWRRRISGISPNKNEQLK